MSGKILVVLAHPGYARSRVNRAWCEAIQARPGLADIHPIAQYGQGMRAEDIAAEQRLIEAHGAVILQFPVYDFYMPAVGKIWLDEVFCWGWAFGPTPDPKHNRMRGLPMGAAASAGCPARDLRAGGQIGFSLEECLCGLHAFARYGGARWVGMHTLAGAEGSLPDEAVRDNARQYVAFLERVAESL